MPEGRDRSNQKITLGQHLAALRNAAGLTLRQVEDASEKEVSNAYLSQLEKDKISKPSPNILYALAQVYSTSYDDLMGRAGYLPAAQAATGRRQAARPAPAAPPASAPPPRSAAASRSSTSCSA